MKNRTNPLAPLPNPDVKKESHENCDNPDTIKK